MTREAVHGAMRRDEREDWPDDAPVGTYDIVSHGLDKFILFVCPKGQRCGVHVSTEAEAGGDPPTWKWDGDYEKPTLTPSINCIGGCGWHGFITGGKTVGA